MSSLFVAFLAVMNPIALYLYLEPVERALKRKQFLYVLLKACLISFFIYIFFAFTGTFIFEDILMVNYESFRIFGGTIVFGISWIFIIKGEKALIHIKENLDDIANEIALPFMVGAASISLAILIGNNYTAPITVLMIFGVLAACYVTIVGLQMIRRSISRKELKDAFDKNMHILLRLNGFLMGTFGVDMIATGVNNMFLVT